MFFSALPDECDNRALQQVCKSWIISFHTFTFHYYGSHPFPTICSFTNRVSVVFLHKNMNILHYWNLYLKLYTFFCVNTHFTTTVKLRMKWNATAISRLYLLPLIICSTENVLLQFNAVCTVHHHTICI